MKGVLLMSTEDSAPLSEKMQNKFFEMAKHESMLSDNSNQKLGALIVYKNKIIASSPNQNRTNPKQKEYNKLRGFAYDTPNNGQVHAELGCILQTKNMENIDWSKASVFVFRQHKNGTRGCSCPCAACKQAIKDRGIKRIYYTGEDSYIFERIG